MKRGRGQLTRGQEGGYDRPTGDACKYIDPFEEVWEN